MSNPSIYWKQYDEPVVYDPNPIIGSGTSYGEWQCDSSVVKSFKFWGKPFLDSDHPVRLSIQVELVNGKSYEDTEYRNQQYAIINGREPYQDLVDKFHNHLNTI